MTHRIAVLVLLVLGSCGPLFGQSAASGQLNGTVTDQSGAAVANAKVTVVNEATNVGATVLTNPAGQYRIFNLLPSLYDLTIEAPGFKTVQIAGLKINVDQTLTQDSVISLGSVAEKVEVSAQADLLERTTVSESTVIQEKVVQDLPLLIGSSHTIPGSILWRPTGRNTGQLRLGDRLGRPRLVFRNRGLR